MNTEIDIKIADIKEVKWLIESINNYFNELPKELQNIIMAFANRGIGDIDAEEFYKRFGYGEFNSSLNTKKILKINEILKTVTYINEDSVEVTEKIKTFWIKLDGKTVIEWK